MAVVPSASVISVSATRQPDSRRSASIGRLSWRYSSWRLSCESVDDRRLELAGEDLQAARQLRHLDLTVLADRPGVDISCR